MFNTNMKLLLMSLCLVEIYAFDSPPPRLTAPSGGLELGPPSACRLSDRFQIVGQRAVDRKTPGLIFVAIFYVGCERKCRRACQRLTSDDVSCVSFSIRRLRFWRCECVVSELPLETTDLAPGTRGISGNRMCQRDVPAPPVDAHVLRKRGIPFGRGIFGSATSPKSRTTENPWGPTENPWGPTENPWGPTKNPWGPTKNPWGSTKETWGPSTANPWVPPTSNPWRPSTGNPWGPSTGNPWGPTKNPWGPTKNPWGPTKNPWGPTKNPWGPSTGNPWGPSTGKPLGPSTGNPWGPSTGKPWGPSTGNPSTRKPSTKSPPPSTTTLSPSPPSTTPPIAGCKFGDDFYIVGLRPVLQYHPEAHYVDTWFIGCERKCRRSCVSGNSPAKPCASFSIRKRWPRRCSCYHMTFPLEQSVLDTNARGVTRNRLCEGETYTVRSR